MTPLSIRIHLSGRWADGLHRPNALNHQQQLQQQKKHGPEQDLKLLVFICTVELQRYSPLGGVLVNLFQLIKATDVEQRLAIIVHSEEPVAC